MSGKELLLKALRNEMTPRPAWVPFVGVHGGKIIGETATNYLKSADLLVAGLSKAVELYQPDGLPLIFDLQMEAEVLGCGLVWSNDTPPSVSTHPLEDKWLVELPEFDTTAGRYPMAAEALTTMKEKFGEQIALYGLITGPFTLTLHLMGNNVFLQMFEAPEKVKEVLEFCTEVAKKAADFYLDGGADVVAVVDPMTSQISPTHFAEFVQPYVDAIFDHIRERGGLSSLFVCGNATRNLEAMCQCTCDNVSIDENIPLDMLRELAQKNAKSYGGNLKLTTVLLLGSENDARRDAISCLETGNTPGFVLAPGCDLPYSTPEANLQAVAEMVHDEYKREVAKATVGTESELTFDDIDLPNYTSEAKVIIDVITLDSASCAPCQYMVGAVSDAAKELPDLIEIREHKITTRDGLAHMAKLGVGQIPTICIDGEVKFPSLIPDIDTLIKAIQDKALDKQK